MQVETANLIFEFISKSSSDRKKYNIFQLRYMQRRENAFDMRACTLCTFPNYFCITFVTLKYLFVDDIRL